MSKTRTIQEVKYIVRKNMEILRNSAKADGEALKELVHTTDWQKVERNMDRLFDSIEVFAVRFGRNVGQMALIGIVMHIIAAHFWPEMPDKIPTIYSWFDGWLQSM